MLDNIQQMHGKIQLENDRFRTGNSCLELFQAYMTWKRGSNEAK